MSKTRDLEHYKRYGWKVNEDNLNTLPEEAPEVARDLTKWLTLASRRSSLEEWLGCVQADSRIHGKFWHIGAWTHRMSHSNPNQANIMSVFHGTPKNGVEEAKEKYDGRLRALFKSDHWLVGCDADGIQLRILAHYMQSSEYRDAIVSGDKAMSTDIHNVNRRALGSVCRDRDVAKTFIYAWLLGAGIPKIASILNCSIPQAKRAEEDFLAALPELSRVKKVLVPRDAARGFFKGLDGRKVNCTSTHLMLAGYLQNGEAVIMKHATKLWMKRANKAGIKFRMVNFVHDEWQTECYGSKEDAEKLGKIQAQAIADVGDELGLFCPLEGSYVVGKDWRDTH